MNSAEYSSENESTKSKYGKKENIKKKGKDKSLVNERAIKVKKITKPSYNELSEKNECRDNRREVNSNQIKGVTLLCDNDTFRKEGNEILSENEKDNKVNQNDNFKEVTSYPVVQNIANENDDWEKLYDEGSVGKGIDETNLKKLSQEISNMSITSSQIESDGSSVIEIYGFPEEFKTQDLLKVFAVFVNRGFKLRWVDDTHALGIFPSPVLADEALSTHLPFVKTRPLSQATESSKLKAKSIVLPSSMRPKTCSSLAKRLVSGALGIKSIVSPAERQAELEILREAKEQKRLAAKQREAAWEGRF